MILRIIAAILIIVTSAGSMHAQSFSCRSGQPSCIEFNEKIVRSDAQCFDPFQCNSGFVCKKDFDELGDNARQLAQSYDDFYNCVAKATEGSEVGRCLSRHRYP